MSDLADLASDVTKDLPIAVRRVIDTALENNWQLNKPGMTVALRLNHPTDNLAMPVYITWTVGRTPKGALSFRFMSCGTQGLHKLSGADLLEYLKDPTVVYDTEEELAAKEDKFDRKKLDNPPKWDEQNKTPEENTIAQFGNTEIVAIEVERPRRQYKPRSKPSVKPSSKLRVQIPKA